MGVQRFIPGVKKPQGFLIPFMSPNPQGGFVSFEDYDHLQSRCEELEEALKEAVHAGETLALHTHGRSENREVSEAKEQLQRGHAALQKGGDDG